jgi:hypothetical protein
VITLRGGSGLGDSIYLRPLVDHFVRQGEKVTVCSDYPDIFAGSGATTAPFRREQVDVVGHYVVGKHRPDTTQWEDVCLSARVPRGLPLRMEWDPPEDLRRSWLGASGGRPVVLVHGGRAPMERKDGFGAELLPREEAFRALIASLSALCFLARVGKNEPGYDLPVHIDMRGRTSVRGLIDLASVCDGIVAQPSFCIPLAEALGKPLLCIWAAHGMEHTRHPYIKAITPQKVLSAETSAYVVDDWTPDALSQAARAFSDRVALFEHA